MEKNMAASNPRISQDRTNADSANPDERSVYFDGQAIGQLLEHKWEDARGSLSLKLIGICAGAFVLVALLDLLGIAEREAVWSLFGLSHPGIFERLWLHQFLTAPLLHATAGQVVFMALSLWLFGPSLEKELGPRRFVFFGILCIAAGQAAFLLLAGGTRFIVTGLSSFTAGVFIAHACLFPDHVIPVHLFFRVKLKYAAFLMIAVQFYMVLTEAAPDMRWLHFSQFAGPAAGFLLIRLWSGGKGRQGMTAQPRSATLRPAGKRPLSPRGTLPEDDIPPEL
jgi:membrane associated rhomboid family serine protease